MERHTHTSAQMNMILSRKWSFFVIVVLVFVATCGMLSALDLLPTSSQTLKARADVVTGPVSLAKDDVASEFPTKISIPSLDLETIVSNPTSASLPVLDALLLKGAVRYPTSGLLGTKGSNVVIFAHASYLPIVKNQAYKAFNGIQNLKQGEKIYVSGKDRTFVYLVETVAKADASNAGVPLTVEGNKLTLITCDSFASKNDRFVVIAVLVESYPTAK